MKRRIILLVVVMAVLVPPTLGEDIPFTETIVIERFGNKYSESLPFLVYVQDGSTIEIENREIKIDIGPDVFMEQEGKDALDNKELFLKVLVSIAWGDTNFESYLNCKCGEHGGQLFWDHAGEDRADKAGEPFLPHPPLIVEDKYFKVTLRLINLEISSEKCGVNHPQYLNCDSDYDCLFYMDSLTLTLTVDYSHTQENLKSQYETGLEPETSPTPEPTSTPEPTPPPKDPLELEKAVQHEEEAANLFNNGEYQKAITEYQKARAIYDRLGDSEKVRDIRDQIGRCNSYIVAENDLEKGIELFHEAEKIEDSEEAIEKYEEALSLFESTKDKYTELSDTDQFEKCQDWIDDCNDQINTLTTKIKTKTYLTIGAIAAAAVVGAGVVVYKLIGKKPVEEIPRERTIPKRIRPVPPLPKGPRIIFEDQIFNITKDLVTIGRGEAADIQIQDPKNLVSRIHAKIYRDERGQYWIRDNNSENGTFIYTDGRYKRVRKWLLCDGDMIVLSYDPSRGARIIFQYRSN